MSNTALLFMFLCFAGLLLAFVKHPIYGMYSYMLVFYMSPGESWWSADVPELPWAFLTAGATMIAAMLYPAPPSRPPWYQTAPARWLILLALWLWMQAPWALSLDNHVFLASLFSKYVLLYAVLYTCLTEQKNIRQFFLVHILGCFLWGYMAYQNPGSGRLEDLGFGDVAGSAFASMHLATGMAFAGFAFLGAAGIQRWLAFSSIPFVLNAIILMATRGAFVGLIGGALAALLLSPKSQRRMIVLSLGLGAILLMMLAHDLFWERMGTIAPPKDGQQMEESAASRIDIAEANFRMFLDYPMGVGHRGNDLLSPNYMAPDLLTPKEGRMIRSAHNTFMAILVDHGFIGLILAVGLHLSVVRSLLRTRSQASPDLGREFAAYNAALITALVIYWGNAQFVNVTKAEVVIWIAALTAALRWMAVPAPQPEESRDESASPAPTPENDDVRNPAA
jgi:hypothetical protein